MNINKSKILSRIKNFKKKSIFKKKKIKFKNVDNWKFDHSIIHSSKKFFKIYGYLIKSNFPKKISFFQPLISQNELGYLVIFKAKKKNKSFFLLQLKAEPGNQNIIQLSPTIQATKSNYSRVHGGKRTKFLEYTKNVKNFLLNINQPEQGSRYLGKFNRNIIIKTNKLKNLPQNFTWIGRNELIKLSKKNNLLNMDTISILSCYLKKNDIDNPIQSYKELIKIYLEFKDKFYINLKKISLREMKKWKFESDSIYDLEKKFFKIQSFNIKTNFREVSKWSQPLISDHYKALNVLLIRKHNGTPNYLCQIILEPGYKNPKFTSTIMLKNFQNKNFKYQSNSFIKENNIKIKKKIFEVINSDEGGRFNNNQSLNYVYEVSECEITKRQNYIWISYNQMLKLIEKKLITIELRNLFGIINLKNLK